ncbi:MAG: biotin/lipoyl-containing protein, partial [Myxococcota bacterium]
LVLLSTDSGVSTGTEVGIHYDPMLAKIICHAATRAEAIDRMIYALRNLAVQGLVNNREFLIRVLSHPAFVAGEVDTHFIERHHAELLAVPVDGEGLRRAAVAAVMAGFAERRAARAILPALEPGFRNNPGDIPAIEYRCGDHLVRCDYRNASAGTLLVRATVAQIEQPSAQPDEDRAAAATADESVPFTLVEWQPPELVIEDNLGHRRRFRVVGAGDRIYVHSAEGGVVLRELPRFPDAGEAQAEGGLVAPMPGKVIKVLVSPGEKVAAGQTLAVLEAMKMEHALTAPHDGEVSEVAVAEGDQVAAEALIAVLTPADES